MEQVVDLLLPTGGADGGIVYRVAVRIVAGAVVALIAYKMLSAMGGHR